MAAILLTKVALQAIKHGTPHVPDKAWESIPGIRPPKEDGEAARKSKHKSSRNTDRDDRAHRRRHSSEPKRDRRRERDISADGNHTPGGRRQRTSMRRRASSYSPYNSDTSDHYSGKTHGRHRHGLLGHDGHAHQNPPPPYHSVTAHKARDLDHIQQAGMTRSWDAGPYQHHDVAPYATGPAGIPLYDPAIHGPHVPPPPPPPLTSAVDGGMNAIPAQAPQANSYPPNYQYQQVPPPHAYNSQQGEISVPNPMRQSQHIHPASNDVQMTPDQNMHKTILGNEVEPERPSKVAMKYKPASIANTQPWMCVPQN